MPKPGQKYGQGLTRAAAIAEFGESAIDALPRQDNIRMRGVPGQTVARLRAARTVHHSTETLVLEGAGVPISAKERGALLAMQRAALAILRANPDQFRQVLALLTTMLPPEAR